MLGLLHVTNHTRVHTHLQRLLLGSKTPQNHGAVRDLSQAAGRLVNVALLAISYLRLLPQVFAQRQLFVSKDQQKRRKEKVEGAQGERQQLHQGKGLTWILHTSAQPSQGSCQRWHIQVTSCTQQELLLYFKLV